MTQDDDILTRIRSCHGAVRLLELQLDRTERRHVDRLVGAGELIAYPRGVVGLLGAERNVVLARIHGGVITCQHAAHYYGYPQSSSWNVVHLAIPHGRYPHTGDLGGYFYPHARELVHIERSLELPAPTAYPVAPVPLMLARFLRCDGRPEGPLMACDAALHQSHTTAAAIAALLRGPGSRQARDRLSLASARARSPLETKARLQFHDAGINFADGVQMPGVGEVDFVIEGWLVVEVDGYSYHNDDYQFAADRWRDRELFKQGYRVARFTRQEVENGRIVSDVKEILASRHNTQPTQ